MEWIDIIQIVGIVYMVLIVLCVEHGSGGLR